MWGSGTCSEEILPDFKSVLGAVQLIPSRVDFL